MNLYDHMLDRVAALDFEIRQQNDSIISYTDRMALNRSGIETATTIRSFHESEKVVIQDWLRANAELANAPA